MQGHLTLVTYAHWCYWTLDYATFRESPSNRTSHAKWYTTLPGGITDKLMRPLRPPVSQQLGANGRGCLRL